MKYGFGVDLGGTTVKIAYFDEQGTMLSKWEIPTITADGGKQILPDIAASIRQFIEQKTIDPADVIGVGIGVPGPVNSKGVVNKCVNLGWGVFNIAENLGKLVGFPVKAGNDANVAALGEFWKGGGQGCDNMIFVTLGTGVGGGIVVEGHLLHGAHGAGGEIGHLVLERGETDKCGCGKTGCVEQYCSATGIVRLAKKALAAYEGVSQLSKFDPLTCKDIFDCGKAGDELALQVLDRYWAAVSARLVRCCWTAPVPTLTSGASMLPAAHVSRWLLWATMPVLTVPSSWHWMPSISNSLHTGGCRSGTRCFFEK